MNKVFGVKGLIAGMALLLSSGAALARVDVGINIDIPGPYVRPAPIYVEPQPVYVQPRPVYVQPRPVYVHPQPVYVQPRPIVIEQRGYRHGHGHHHGWEHRRGHGGRDRDHDGVPNRFDRRPDNPYRY